MLSEITWKQFLEWVAYSGVEPFDETRSDIRAAQIVTMLANVNRDPKKKRTPYEIKDFILNFGDDVALGRKKKTWQEMKMAAKLWVALGQD